MGRAKREGRVFVPTSHEIREACERIQEGWSERERRKRAGWIEGGRWLPPLVEIDSLLYEASRAADPHPY